MAVQIRTRFRPDIYTDKAIVGNAAPDGSSGILFLPVEAFQYDDQIVTAQNYKPGHPDTEAEITVIFRDVLQLDLAAFVGKTANQRNAILDAALDQWATANKALGGAIAPITLAAQTRMPRVIPG